MSHAAAAQVVRSFFDAYRAHDVDAMVRTCSECADFHYVPFEMWGKQRVLRGDGKVHSIGRVLWTGLIESFPNLTNEVTSIEADSDGNVAAEVAIRGTQAKVWGAIANRGKAFDVPHLFLFRVDAAGRIGHITAYWDGAEFNRQLGRIEID